MWFLSLHLCNECLSHQKKKKTSDQTSAQVLQELESRWTASLQASPSGRDRLSSDLPDSQPAWMAPSGGHRQHWSQRQQQQQAQQQQPAQQPRQLPSDRAANNDTMDVLGDPGDPPQLIEWRRLWQLASAAYLNRQHRVLWWRILHGCVMCGAFSAYIGRATPQQACCPFFFFFFFFFGWERHSLQRCNERNHKCL